jgi:hypothetical protein
MTGIRTQHDIGSALTELRPGASWVVRNNDYNQIEWHESNKQALPSLEEIEAKIQELNTNEPLKVLRDLRNIWLQQTDWTQSADLRAIRGREWCQKWDNYRQQLRDLPSTVNKSALWFNEVGALEGYTLPTQPVQR